MSLFGRRKPEQNPVGVFEAAQQAFTRDFKEWLARIEDAQERSGSAQLSGEILAIAGAVPLYDRTGLNTTQLVYMLGRTRRSDVESVMREALPRMTAADVFFCLRNVLASASMTIA